MLSSLSQGLERPGVDLTFWLKPSLRMHKLCVCACTCLGNKQLLQRLEQIRITCNQVNKKDAGKAVVLDHMRNLVTIAQDIGIVNFVTTTL